MRSVARSCRRIPRFSNNTQRMAHLEELKQLIQDWFDSLPTDEEAYRRLQEHRVPFAQVLSIEEAMAHPHLREREVVRTVNDRFLGDFDVPGFPLRFSGYERHPVMQAPTLGEHNEAQQCCAIISAIRPIGSRSSRARASCITARAEPRVVAIGRRMTARRFHIGRVTCY